MHHSDRIDEARPISVIICSLSDEPGLGPLLNQLKRCNPTPEVVVAMPQLCPKLQAAHESVVWVKATRGRAQQLNEGARASSGRTILFLHADSKLPDDAMVSIQEATARPGVVGGAFRLALDAEGLGFRIIEKAINFRTRCLRMPYGDQGIFLLRWVHEKIGGFRELDIMEDADLVRRARRLGDWALCESAMTTSARRWQTNGLFRTTLVNFITQIGEGMGVSHGSLRRFYDRHLSNGRPTATDKSSGRVRTVLMLVLLMAATITSIVYRSDIIRSLFGPPDVDAHEQYERREGAPSFDHSVWDAVLKDIVNADGTVDYKRLHDSPTGLNRYIEQLAECDFDALDRDGKLALLINAYNAFTLRLIVDHYPIKSIRDIPSSKRWGHKRWQIGDLTLSLEEIENDYLRGRFAEPRIHFAINCASQSCPPLRPEAFTPALLEKQLQEQTTQLHGAGSFASYDSERATLTLNPIYDWYRSDFHSDEEGLIRYAAGFMPALKRDLEKGISVSISWKTYDWSLNKTP